MKTTLVYVHPVINSTVYSAAARRFTESYMNNPPGESDHEIVVCLNGGTKGPDHDKLFAPLPVRFIEHSNWGKDIGAFQLAAETIPCDLLVCFGSHIYFHHPGWLDRMVQVCEENGPSIYGAWGMSQPLPHLRTTGFWLPPELLRGYPRIISDNERYSFEHGNESITLWSQKIGFEPFMVTWSGVFPMKDWHMVGRQEALVHDQWYDGRGGP